MEQLFIDTVVASWRQVINRLDHRLLALSEEQLEKEVASGKNRVFYLLGHLAAIHDNMLPLLGIGPRLHPELDEPYLQNPDLTLPDPLSAADLKKAWSEINSAITRALEHFSREDWLSKHASVSQEDFVVNPTRNKLGILLNRTNHAAYHAGQIVLAR